MTGVVLVGDGRGVCVHMCKGTHVCGVHMKARRHPQVSSFGSVHLIF